MTADVKQDDFFLCDQERKGNPVTVREADSKATIELATQGMECEVRLIRVFPQVVNHFGKTRHEVRVL